MAGQVNLTLEFSNHLTRGLREVVLNFNGDHGFLDAVGGDWRSKKFNEIEDKIDIRRKH
jgi:hypothetical protein